MWPKSNAKVVAWRQDSEWTCGQSQNGQNDQNLRFGSRAKINLFWWIVPHQSTMWQPCIPTFCKLYIIEHVCELNKVQITEHLQTVHSNTLRKVFSRVYLGVLIWPLWSIFLICFFSTKVVASTLTSGWTCCQSFSGSLDMLHFNFVALVPKWR